MQRTETLLHELVWFLAPALQAFTDKESLTELVESLGIEPTDEDLERALADLDPMALELAEFLGEAVEAESDAADGGAVDVRETAIRALLLTRRLAASGSLRAIVGDSDVFFRDLLTGLTWHYLESRVPVASELLKAVGVIVEDEVVSGELGHTRLTLRWDRLGLFLRDPSSWALEVYGWGADPEVHGRAFDYDAALNALANIVEASGLGLATDRRLPADEAREFLANYDPQQHGRAVEIAIPLDQRGVMEDDAGLPTILEDGTPVYHHEAGIKVVPFGDLHQRATVGLAIAPYTKGETEAVRDLSEQLTLDFSVEAAATGGAYITLAPNGTGVALGEAVRARFGFLLTYRNEDRQPIVLAQTKAGTRLQIDAMTAGVAGEMTGAIQVSSGVTGLLAIVDVGEEALLSSIVDGPIEVPVGDVSLIWRSGVGVAFEGGSALGVGVPLDVRAGPLDIRSAHLRLDLDDTATWALTVSAALSLGPVRATVDGIGLEAAITEGAGVLGDHDLDFGFVAPAGIALDIDAGPISGGGFLYSDPNEPRYAGTVQLDVDGLALNAIGLLTTRLPDDADGYSLLVLVSAADFAPVNLGFGFTLDGVGGLLGVNRAADVDELRGRLRGGGLDAIAFPDDPVGSAGEVVGRLRSMFPPTPGRHLVGPTALIGWGTPTMLTIELVLALELPEPLRLVALAQLRARLPSEERTLVRLNMDAIGVVDFDRGRVSLDAVLYDSQVVGQSIGGAMALRARWLGRPGFVLAVGGLNPRYEPPADFPELEPLSLTFERSRAEVRLEAYLALTSNTAQVGARLTVEVSASRFTLDGMLQFDALFEFAPFRFVVDIAGRVRLRWGSRTLAGVYLEMTLAGPLPLHARGKATFKIGFLSLSASFDRTLDAGEPPAVPAPADPIPELLEALADPRSWSAVPPVAQRSMVSLRRVAGATALVHPLGELTVRQRVVPLEVRIERYGQRALVGGPREFDLAVTLPEGAPVQARTVSDHFAPAQFFDLDDDDKLSAPAFQPLPAGVRLETPDAAFGGHDDPALMTSAPVGYDTRVIDGAGPARDAATYTASASTIRGAITRRARVLSGTAQARGNRYRGPGLGLRLRDPVYVVARREDLRVDSFVASGGSDGLSHAAAVQLLRGTEQPDQGSRLQVVARHESVAAIPGLLPPGASPEEPGIYLERSGFGRRVPGGRRVRMAPDSTPLPPTRAPGRRWQWVAPLHAEE